MIYIDVDIYTYTDIHTEREACIERDMEERNKAGYNTRRCIPTPEHASLWLG